MCRGAKFPTTIAPDFGPLPPQSDLHEKLPERTTRRCPQSSSPQGRSAAPPSPRRGAFNNAGTEGGQSSKRGEPSTWNLVRCMPSDTALCSTAPGTSSQRPLAERPGAPGAARSLLGRGAAWAGRLHTRARRACKRRTRAACGTGGAAAGRHTCGHRWGTSGGPLLWVRYIWGTSAMRAILRVDQWAWGGKLRPQCMNTASQNQPEMSSKLEFERASV